MRRISITAEVDPYPGKHPSLEDVRLTLLGAPIHGSGADDGYQIGELRDVSVHPIDDPAPKPVAEWPSPDLVCTSEYRAIQEVCEDVDDPALLAAILSEFIDTAAALLAGK
jgi:hypothetical protein